MEGFRRKRLFFHEKRHSVWAKILFTVVISSCIILLTCHGLNRLMADSKEEEKRSLEEALQRNRAVLCAGRTLPGQSFVSGRTVWFFL